MGPEIEPRLHRVTDADEVPGDRERGADFFVTRPVFLQDLDILVHRVLILALDSARVEQAAILVTDAVERRRRPSPSLRIFQRRATALSAMDAAEQLGGLLGDIGRTAARVGAIDEVDQPRHELDIALLLLHAERSSACGIADRRGHAGAAGALFQILQLLERGLLTLLRGGTTKATCQSHGNRANEQATPMDTWHRHTLPHAYIRAELCVAQDFAQGRQRGKRFVARHSRRCESGNRQFIRRSALLPDERAAGLRPERRDGCRTDRPASSR